MREKFLYKSQMHHNNTPKLKHRDSRKRLMDLNKELYPHKDNGEINLIKQENKSKKL